MFILEVRCFEKKYGYHALNKNGFKDLEIYEEKLKNYLGVKNVDKEIDEENEGLVRSDGEFEVIEEVEGEEGSIIWENENKKSEEIFV